MDVAGAHVAPGPHGGADDAAEHHHVAFHLDLRPQDLLGLEVPSPNPEPVLYGPGDDDVPLECHMTRFEIHVAVDPEANVDPPGNWLWAAARSGKM